MARETRNAFEALCELAAAENWCWKIFCSTCGHHYFRFSFVELAGGSHPDSASWHTRRDNHHQLEGQLGPAPRLARWPLGEQETLIEIFGHASLGRIAAGARYLDWLGYLGLALFHTEQAERRSRSLTHAWIPQLLEIVRRGTDARGPLEAILTSNVRTLSWPDLARIEHDVITADG